MRKLTAKDPGGAAVGAEETTMNASPYHYNFHGLDVVFWDMPGCGTKSHPQESYIRNMGLKYFDNVLFLNSNRFRSCDIAIGQELKKMSVPHYFIKTKANLDFLNEELENDFEPEQTKKNISKKMKDEHGIEKVYFVGRYTKKRPDPYVDYYDYEKLMMELLCNLLKFRTTGIELPAECDTL